MSNYETTGINSSETDFPPVLFSNMETIKEYYGENDISHNSALISEEQLDYMLSLGTVINSYVANQLITREATD